MSRAVQATPEAATSKRLYVENYNLAMTLNSGQAFRWYPYRQGFEGVVRGHWVYLEQQPKGLLCETAEPMSDWSWLEEYLQVKLNITAVVNSFPQDEPMQAAVKTCSGLRLLKQEPWEVLASYILSSTKQIVQIKQVVASISKCFGTEIKGPAGHEKVFAFPCPDVIANATEQELRACKMGFRAPYLKAAAMEVASGTLNLEVLRGMDITRAREELETLHGVGPKVANCVLLSAYNMPTAFPLDVWVLRALRELYFPGKRPAVGRLRDFAATHFGPFSGYAQLYLFHFMRTIRTGEQKRKKPSRSDNELNAID